MLGAKSVIGVDYNDDGLKIAKKNFKHKNLFFLKQDVLNLKFKSRSFDIVFSNGVLHHTNNLEKGIKELHRVCKKAVTYICFCMVLVVYTGLLVKK